jgi:hypothetical protein
MTGPAHGLLLWLASWLRAPSQVEGGGTGAGRWRACWHSRRCRSGCEEARRRHGAADQAAPAGPAGRAAAAVWHSSLRGYQAQEQQGQKGQQGQQGQRPIGQGLAALILARNQVGPGAAPLPCPALPCPALPCPALPFPAPQGAAPFRGGVPRAACPVARLLPPAGNSSTACGTSSSAGRQPGADRRASCRAPQVTSAGAAALQRALAAEHLQLALLDLSANRVGSAPQLGPAFEAAMRQAGVPAVVDLRNQQQQQAVGPGVLLLCMTAAAAGPLLLKLGIDVEALALARPPAPPRGGAAKEVAKAGSRPSSAAGGSYSGSRPRSYSQMGNRLLQQALQQTAAPRQQPAGPRQKAGGLRRSAGGGPPGAHAGSGPGCAAGPAPPPPPLAPCSAPAACSGKCAGRHPSSPGRPSAALWSWS